MFRVRKSLIFEKIVLKSFVFSPEEIDKVTRQSNPAEAILQRWGNRGQNVQSLIVRLQVCREIIHLFLYFALNLRLVPQNLHDVISSKPLPTPQIFLFAVAEF